MNRVLIIAALLFLSGCSAQTYNQRFDGGLAGVIGAVIRNGANAAAGGSFDTQQVINESIYVGSSEAQGQVYDIYYQRIREQHQKDALEQEYQIWAEQENRKNGIKDKDEYFRRRYYGK